MKADYVMVEMINGDVIELALHLCESGPAAIRGNWVPTN
jgi:hypothetical protein